MRPSIAVSLLLLCPPVFARQTGAFRSDAAHTGDYGSSGIASFHKLKWQFHTAGQILSSPVVADGTVFFGSNDHYLRALDLATGAEKWKFKTGGRIPSSPAIADGLVYFLSYDGNFYAVDEARGKVKWKYATGGERRFAAKHLHGMEPAAETMPDPFDFYLSSPTVAGGLVYFGSSDSNVYALDAGTGTLQWKFKTGDGVHSSPAVTDGTLSLGVGIPIFTRWTPQMERRNGVSKRVKTTKPIIKPEFKLHRQLLTALFIWDAGTQIFTQSMQGPGKSSGPTIIKDPG